MLIVLEVAKQLLSTSGDDSNEYSTIGNNVIFASKGLKFGTSVVLVFNQIKASGVCFGSLEKSGTVLEPATVGNFKYM